MKKYTHISVVMLFFLSSVAVVSLMYVTIPLMATLGDEFQTPMQQTVWISSFYGIAYAMGCLIFGFISDRFQRKAILFWGFLFLSIFTGLVGMSGTFHAMLFFRIIQGVAAASIPIVLLAYVSDILPPRIRSVAISVISSGFLLAGMIGQLYGQVMAASLGWRSAFFLLAVFYLFFAGLLIRLPKGFTPQPDQTFIQTIRHHSKALNKPAIFFSLIVTATLLLSFVAMYAGVSNVVSKGDLINQAELLWMKLAGIPAMFVSLWVGSLTKKFSTKGVLIIGLICAWFGMAGVVWIDPFVLFVLASVLFVIGISLANPCLIMIISELAGKSKGSLLALNAFSGFIGASVGSFLAGYLPSFFNLSLVLWIILSISIVLAWYFLHPFQREREVTQSIR